MLFLIDHSPAVPFDLSPRAMHFSRTGYPRRSYLSLSHSLSLSLPLTLLRPGSLRVCAIDIRLVAIIFVFFQRSGAATTYACHLRAAVCRERFAGDDRSSSAVPLSLSHSFSLYYTHTFYSPSIIFRPLHFQK
jgi:hypothetical protein